MRKSVRFLSTIVVLFLERRRSRLLMIVLVKFEMMSDRTILYMFKF